MGINVTDADVMAELQGVASQDLIGRSPKSAPEMCQKLGGVLCNADLAKTTPVPTR